MNNQVIYGGNYSNGFAITPSDTVDVKDDINNLYGATSVFLHNISASATVRVLPASGNNVAGLTLTGSSGTANVTVNGVAYLATYTSSLTVSATNFVNSHKAALAERGITVTSNGAQLRFTGAVSQGQLSVANATGNLSGTALAVSPITIYIPQGAVSPIAVKRVYNTTPTPPANLVGLI